ncbi:Carbohydrate sulfotransferase 11 [Nymphon striatum]|nr:Carbohydrate sulfotransferase 11 [Nymphon striatum]
MDDYISGADTQADMTDMTKGATDIMRSAGMEFREWNGNCPSLNVLKQQCNVLGISWDCQKDYLSLQPLKEKFIRQPVSKRNVLAFISQTFDPSGFLSPVIIKGKILMQKLWKLSLGWDQPITDCYLLNEIKSIVQDLQKVEQLEIPRCYFRRQLDIVSLHVFCDASKSAYSAVVYVTSDSEASIVISKTRVSPLKEVSLLKLELLGCLIGARLIARIRNIVPKFKQANCYCWTDSTIALAWLKAPIDISGSRNICVTNRVKEIQSLTENMVWNHVSSPDNPADLATRSNTTFERLLNTTVWWNGPSWITEPSTHWPNSFPCTSAECPDIVNTCVSTETTSHDTVEPLFDLSQLSRLGHVLRVTAYVLRWTSKIKLPTRSRTLTTIERKVCVPSVDELERARIYWIKYVQNLKFEEDLQNLRKSKKCKLSHLGPVIDSCGLLRSVGRTHRVHSSNPIILPPNSELTRLIVLDYHERLFHAGVTLTLAEIRSKYWIIRGRQTIKRTINQCLVCKRHKVLPYLQLPSALPEWRLAERPPFSASGIDFCGPFNTTEGKTYILLFTCCSTRAIHLEVTSDMSATSVINAIRRFISRRGKLDFIISDNAKSFIKARQSLAHIKWVMIPERAPWWGGFWERLVRSVKNAFKLGIGRSCLTFEDMRTIVPEIESVINKRPITYISEDRDDPKPLRPVDFLLTTEDLPSIIHSSPQEELIGHWKHRQIIIKNVWKRWRTEYLSELHRWTKFPFGKGLPQVGDVVLVNPLNVKNRAFFPLGMIAKLIPGKDGYVRAAYVRVQGKMLRRTTRHLYPLETKGEIVCEPSVSTSDSILGSRSVELPKDLANILTQQKYRPKQPVYEINSLRVKRVEYECRKRPMELPGPFINSLQKKCNFFECPVHIIKEHRFGFCFMHKVASTTFQSHLVKLSGFGPLNKSRIQYHGHRLSRHSTTALMTEPYVRFYKFLFVRHPFRRLVSAYYAKLVLECLERDRPKPGPLCWLSREIVSKYRTNSLPGPATFREFVWYLIDNENNTYESHWTRIVNVCKPCAVHYDFIGKIETSYNDIKYLYETLDIITIIQNATDTLNHSNSQSITSDCFSQISRKEFDKLCEIYKEDFEFFGYTIEEFEAYIRKVEQYKYLGTWVTDNGRCISEVKRRIAKAKDDFWKCKEFLRSNLNIDQKKKLLQTYICSIDSRNNIYKKYKRNEVQSIKSKKHQTLGKIYLKLKMCAQLLHYVRKLVNKKMVCAGFRTYRPLRKSLLQQRHKQQCLHVLAHLWIRAVIVAHANMNKLEESTEHNIVRLESTVSQQLTILYHNELHRVGTHSTPSTSENQMRCCYCQSIIIYITDTRAVTEGTDPVMFRLADLTSLYQQRLEKLGVDSPDINSTRLKEQLLSRYKLEAHQKGLDVLIAFKVTYG